MNKKMIIDAYVRIRTIDNTIADDVLDFMKDAALEKLELIKVSELKPILENQKVFIMCGDKDWIGLEATVKRIKPNGDCEIHSNVDFYNSNIKYIQTTDVREPHHEFCLLKFVNKKQHS